MKQSKSILVVDNESGFHDLFRFNLEPLGFVIDSAYNGNQGWECFQKNSYDIVFSDVHMPGIMGPELLRKIKEANPEQRVVMMSSFSDTEVGGVTCLYKPFEISQLMEVLEQTLGALIGDVGFDKIG